MGRPKGWVLNRKAFEHQLIARRISRAELAVAAGVSPQMLGDLTSKTKKTGASPRNAAALAEVLECPVELLFPQAAGYGAPEFAEVA